jgi:hypothetical protein
MHLSLRNPTAYCWLISITLLSFLQGCIAFRITNSRAIFAARDVVDHRAQFSTTAAFRNGSNTLSFSVKFKRSDAQNNATVWLIGEAHYSCAFPDDAYGVARLAPNRI